MHCLADTATPANIASPAMTTHARLRMDDHYVSPEAVSFVLAHANLRRAGHNGCAVRRISRRRLQELGRDARLPCGRALLSNLVVVTGRSDVVVTLYRDTNPCPPDHDA